MVHGERPFDARFTLLIDRDSPASAWRTVSLVTAIREFLHRDPVAVIPSAAEHCELLNLCADELTDRGLDASSLVRFGMIPELLAGVLGPYLASKIDPSTQPDDNYDSLFAQRADGWAAVLDDHLRQADLLDEDSGLIKDFANPLTAHRLTRVLTVAVQFLVPWVQQASLPDLFSLTPPTPEWLADHQPDNVDNDVLKMYRWAAERFSVTRIQEWSMDSLLLEYRFLRDGGAAPCAEILMSDRTIEVGALESEIARRSIRQGGPAELPQVRASLAIKMQQQASGLLKAGRFEAAATLFEFAVTDSPEDESARNNLGFCLMPRDPGAALEHLDAADRLGYEPLVVNVYNRILCVYMLRGVAAALKLAEQEWERVQEGGPALAVLWTLDEAGNLVLSERAEALSTLASLGLWLAEAGGRVEQISTWRSRTAA